MKKSYFMLVFLLTMPYSSGTLATKFAGTPPPSSEIVEKTPEFLTMLGIETETRKEYDLSSKERVNPYLIVEFTTKKWFNDLDYHTEILLLNSNNEVLFAIEFPFSYDNRTTTYTIANGHSLMVVITYYEDSNMIYKIDFKI